MKLQFRKGTPEQTNKDCLCKIKIGENEYIWGIARWSKRGVWSSFTSNLTTHGVVAWAYLPEPTKVNVHDDDAEYISDWQVNSK